MHLSSVGETIFDSQTKMACAKVDSSRELARSPDLCGDQPSVDKVMMQSDTSTPDHQCRQTGIACPHLFPVFVQLSITLNVLDHQVAQS
jgi:hypothetical protein